MNYAVLTTNLSAWPVQTGLGNNSSPSPTCPARGSADPADSPLAAPTMPCTSAKACRVDRPAGKRPNPNLELTQAGFASEVESSAAVAATRDVLEQIAAWREKVGEKG